MKLIGIINEFNPTNYTWQSLGKLENKRYLCGHCGLEVGPNEGYHSNNINMRIMICPNCNQPTYFRGNKQIPGPLLGKEIKYLPPEVEGLYQEARSAFTVNAFTLVALACRKLLMHIAVEKGAKEGDSFYEYVGWLDANHYIPPDGKDWVDHIRKKGNEANHEIVLMDKNSAEDLMLFLEQLMNYVYQLPGVLKNRKGN